jgi:hypothetical protein
LYQARTENLKLASELDLLQSQADIQALANGETPQGYT